MEQPKQQQTLDVFSLNNPYMISGSNFVYLQGRLQRIKSSIEELRLYKIGDKVAIRSDGIRDKIKIEKSGETEIQFDATLYSDNVFKKTYTSNYLNIEELLEFLSEKRFIMYSKVFLENLKMEDVPFSNFMSKEKVESSLLPIGEERVVSNKGMVYIFDPILDQSKVILSEDTFDNEFLLCEKIEPKIEVSNDAITTIVAEKMTGVNIMASSSYAYLDDDAVTAGYASSSTKSISSLELTERLRVETNTQGNGILTLGSLNNFASSYAGNLQPELTSLVTKSPISNTLEDDADLDDCVLSGNDVSDMMNTMSKSLFGENISSLEEFATLVDGMCPTTDNYLPLDFDVGSPIYGGTNMANGASLVNVKTFMDYLSPIANKDVKIHNIASFYGKEDYLGDTFDYYAQLTGTRPDFSTLTFGEFVDIVRHVICNLSKLNSTNIPKQPDEVQVEIKSQFYYIPLNMFGLTTFNVPLVFPVIIAPKYVDVPNIYLYIPMSVNYISFTQQLVFPEIQAQPFVPTPQIPFLPMLQSLSSFASQMGDPHRVLSPEPEPSMTPPPINLVIADPFENYLVLFYYDASLEERYVAHSKRQFNMLEVLILLNKLKGIFSDPFYHIDGCVEELVSRDYYAMYILSEAIKIAHSKSNMRFNVDLNFVSESEADKVEEEDAEDSALAENKVNRCTPDIVSASSVQVNDALLLNVIEQEGTTLPSVTSSEILSSDDISLSANGVFDIIDELANIIINKTNDYASGKILHRDSDVDTKMYVFSELDGISVGDILIDYVSAAPAKIRYTYPQSQKGVFSSIGLMDDTKTIVEIVHPFEAITFQSDILTRDRRYAATPLTYGDREFYIWKISDSAEVVDLQNTPVLHIEDSTDAVVDIYDKIVLVDMISPSSYKYYCVGIDFTATTGTTVISGRTLKTLEVGDKKLVFPKEADSLIDGIIKKDYVDDWISPNVLSGFAGLTASIGEGVVQTNTIPDHLFSGAKDNSDMLVENVVLSVNYQDNETEGMEVTLFFEQTEPEITSGVDLTLVENISSLDSLDPNAPEQTDGITPGAYSMTLSIGLVKYEPRVGSSGELISSIKKGKAKLKIIIGVIDGLQDAGGDILAQGYSQDEIPTVAGNPLLYTHPHETLLDYYETRPYTHVTEDGNGFIHKINLAAVIAEQLVDVYTGDTFNTFLDLTNGQYQQGDVFIDTNFNISNSAIKAGDVRIVELKTQGVSFAYKHAGHNPEFPVIRGYYGTSEIDFESGKRLIGTMPSPIPDTFTIDEDVSTESMLQNMELDSIQIAFFVSKYTIEVYCRNVGAILSENRIVTTNVLQ